MDERRSSKYDFSRLFTPVEEGSSFISEPSLISNLTTGGQTSSINVSSGIISRPGTLSRTSHSRATSCVSGTGRTSQQSSIIVALVEGRGLAAGDIGMASIDLKRPELVLSQFSDSPTYVKVMTRLQILHPLEVIMPSTACEAGSVTKLFKHINEQFPNTNLATVQRKYFNETKDENELKLEVPGLQYIKQLCVPEYNTVELEVSAKYYCLATAAALLKYVEFIQNLVYAPHSLKVVFKGSEDTTMIDVATAKNLELISNARDQTSSQSLFGLLNHTKTTSGGRFLRSDILQPPCNLETINLRLDCVQELTEKEEMFYRLELVLKRFLDIDHLISLCVQIPKQESLKTAEHRITQVIHLKHTLELAEPLRDALDGSENALMKAYCEILEDSRLKLMLEDIQAVIHDDTHYQKGSLNMRTQRCFAIKPNVNELVTQTKNHYGFPLKANYSTGRGFFLQLYTGTGASEKCIGLNISQLPKEFLKASKHRNVINFTTNELIRLNGRLNESLNEIYLMTNTHVPLTFTAADSGSTATLVFAADIASKGVVNELLEVIRVHIGCLYKLSEIVALLDMLHSFAHVCTISSHVRPEFTDTMAIKQGRHPVLEAVGVDEPIPNNMYASADTNFIIITGPNMSGKTTYLKQVALLQVVAQIGCFVPAEYASFRIADQIFSRIGSDDDIETNTSTFMLEMKEINYIIQNVGSSPLIVIDELGRGTSSEEGVGLCHAVIEFLLDTKAFTFFATHFLELTSLEALYPNIENYHFEVKHVTEGQRIVYTHMISKGTTKDVHYGLQLAKVSSLPKAVVEESIDVASYIYLQKIGCSSLTVQRNAAYRLGTKLAQVARNSLLDSDSLQAYMEHLRMEYYQELEFPL